MQTDLGREFVFHLVWLNVHLAVNLPAPNLISTHQPAALELRRSHVGAPCAPLGSRERIVLRKIINRLIKRVALIGISRGRRAWRLRKAIESLKSHNGKKPDVHVSQQLPLFLRAPLRDNPSQAVTNHTGGAKTFVGELLVDDSLLSLIERGPCFFGRETMIVAEVLDNLLGFIGSDRQTVQANHPFERLLPTLGSLSLEGYAREVSLIVFLVTRRAAIDHQLALDGNAFFGGLFRFVFRWRRLLLRLSLRLRLGGEGDH